MKLEDIVVGTRVRVVGGFKGHCFKPDQIVTRVENDLDDEDSAMFVDGEGVAQFLMNGEFEFVDAPKDVLTSRIKQSVLAGLEKLEPSEIESLVQSTILGWMSKK